MSRTKHILSYAIPIVILLFFLFGSFSRPMIRQLRIFGTSIFPAAQNIRLGQTISAAASFRVSLKEGKQL